MPLTIVRAGAAGVDHRGNGILGAKPTALVWTAMKPELEMRMQIHLLPAAAAFMIRRGKIGRSKGTRQHRLDQGQRWHRIHVIDRDLEFNARDSPGRLATAASASLSQRWRPLLAAPSADLAALQSGATRSRLHASRGPGVQYVVEVTARPRPSAGSGGALLPTTVTGHVGCDTTRVGAAAPSAGSEGAKRGVCQLSQALHGPDTARLLKTRSRGGAHASRRSP